MIPENIFKNEDYNPQNKTATDIQVTTNQSISIMMELGTYKKGESFIPTKEINIGNDQKPNIIKTKQLLIYGISKENYPCLADKEGGDEIVHQLQLLLNSSRIKVDESRFGAIAYNNAFNGVIAKN
jgi:hypothetical protein